MVLERWLFWRGGSFEEVVVLERWWFFERWWFWRGGGFGKGVVLETWEFLGGGGF